MAGAAVAIIIRREKELVAHFRDSRATSVSSAQSLNALQVHEGMPLRRLRERAVIREGAPGTFYLDEPSWEALRATRRRMALVMLVIVLFAAVAALVGTRAVVTP